MQKTWLIQEINKSKSVASDRNQVKFVHAQFLVEVNYLCLSNDLCAVMASIHDGLEVMSGWITVGEPHWENDV